jgi:hypothetical protein
MKITNKAGLPDALVQAVKNDPYTRGKSDISVTQLIKPPQMRVLERQHWDEIKEDVADRLWALYGQAVHHILDRAGVDALSEERLFAEIRGWTVSGQFDRLTLTQDGTLSDYKMTSVYAVKDGVKPEWAVQLNMLDYLAQQNGHHVGRLEIVALLKDWRRAEAKRDPDYPSVPAIAIEVPRWDVASQYDYMAERVRLHRQAEDGDIPECTPEERWQKPAKWAWMREGRKSAVRLFDSQEAAQAAIESGGKANDYIDYRPGQDVRCESYCLVAAFCEQYQQEEAA